MATEQCVLQNPSEHPHPDRGGEEFALKSPTLRRLNKNQIVDCAEPYELQNEVGSVGLRTLGICVTSTEATRANEDLVLKMLMLENIFCTWPPRCVIKSTGAGF